MNHTPVMGKQTDGGMIELFVTDGRLWSLEVWDLGDGPPVFTEWPDPFTVVVEVQEDETPT
jgi:hypothetical protein